MINYDKMYYTTFNAITDALEIVESLPPSPARENLSQILREAQQNSENIYLSSEDTLP